MGTVTTFDSDKKHLTYLLQQIEQRDLALPDFQRDFVWKPGETRELVRSVMQSFPAGTILLMQGGAKHFKPRSFAQAPDLSGKADVPRHGRPAAPDVAQSRVQWTRRPPLFSEHRRVH